MTTKSPESPVGGPLAPYRVLDLTTDRGYLCAKILGDLGADVIKVEPPGGDPGRWLGPFYQNQPHPERSLWFWSYNLNKRGITLDITTPDGRALLARLLERADFLIESYDPGHLAALGLGYPELRERYPRLVVASITPFGQTGPRAGYQASDLIAWALGGMAYLSGDPDRPPVQITVPQAYLHASGAAAVGSLMAHYHREQTGRGQQVDVSAQLAVVWTLMNETPFPEVYRYNLRRLGAWRNFGAIDVRAVFPCRDGFVSLFIAGGVAGAPSNRRLAELADQAGLCPPEIRDKDWENWDFGKLAKAGEEGRRDVQQVIETFAAFLQTQGKQEIYETAIERRILLAPVNTPQDIVESPQLAARDFFVEVEHPELGVAFRYPGPFAKLSETPITIRRRAPLIGEHNQEIYQGELGLSAEELARLRALRVI